MAGGGPGGEFAGVVVVFIFKDGFEGADEDHAVADFGDFGRGG